MPEPRALAVREAQRLPGAGAVPLGPVIIHDALRTGHASTAGCDQVLNSSISLCFRKAPLILRAPRCKRTGYPVTSFPLPASSKRLPLPYIAALAGLAAVTSATLVLVVHDATSAQGRMGDVDVSYCLCAGSDSCDRTWLPLHALLAGITGRWIVADRKLTPITPRNMGIARDCGCIFVGRSAPFTISLRVLRPTIHPSAPNCSCVTRYSIQVHVDDHRGRILQAAHVYGLAAFKLLGMLAGRARLRSWRSA